MLIWLIASLTVMSICGISVAADHEDTSVASGMMLLGLLSVIVWVIVFITLLFAGV